MPEISRRPSVAAALTSPITSTAAISHGSSDLSPSSIALTTCPVIHGNASEPSWLITARTTESESVSL